MSCLFALGGSYRFILVAAYSVLLGFTLQDLRTTVFATGIVFTTTLLLPPLPYTTLLLLAFAAYMAPELSHYATGDPTVLTLETLTPFTAFVNVAYLLPFSLRCVPT